MVLDRGRRDLIMLHCVFMPARMELLLTLSLLYSNHSHDTTEGVQDLLLEQFYPPLDSYTPPGNDGRVVVSCDSITDWLVRAEEEGVSLTT